MILTDRQFIDDPGTAIAAAQAGEVVDVIDPEGRVRVRLSIPEIQPDNSHVLRVQRDELAMALDDLLYAYRDIRKSFSTGGQFGALAQADAVLAKVRSL